MALQPTPENFRATMGKYMLTRRHVCDIARMRPNQFTDFVNGNIALTDWAAHNIGWALNNLTGFRIFSVDQSLGIVAPSKGRPRKQKVIGGVAYETLAAKRRRLRAKRRLKTRDDD